MGEILICSKHIRTVLVACVLCMHALYAQESPRIDESTHIEAQEQPLQIDESSIAIQQSDMPGVGETSGASTLWLFVRMILVLAVVIACVYAVVWLMRRSMAKRIVNDDSFLRVVSQVHLSPGKSVHIVTLLDEKAYVLGVTDNAITVVGEITNKETIDALNLNADKRASMGKTRTFSDMLSIFMPKEKNIFDGTGNAARDMLRRQRNRLDKTEQ